MLTLNQVRFGLKPIVFLGVSAPFFLLVAQAFEIGVGDLGANPVETVLETLGKTGLNVLLVTLAITPLRRITGWQWLARLRRMLGLGAFFYLALHLITYAVLDQGLDWPTLVADVVERPFITVGFAGVLLMIPLAITSTDRMRRRLGRRWKTLHSLIYPVAILGAVHYYWQTKKDITEPVIYGLVVGILLAPRVWTWFRNRLNKRDSHRGVDGFGSRSTIDHPETPDPVSR